MRIKQIAAVLTIALVCLVLPVRASPQNSGLSEYERQSRESYKKQQKEANKEAKKQIKRIRKAEKKQRKAMNKYEKAQRKSFTR